jgi:Flp pilus assembly protein TadG
MKNWRDERGQTLVLVALTMSALLGFLALAIDVGLLYRAKRNLQIAADAAATAGALDYLYNGSVSSASSAARAAAAANGVNDGSGGTVVTVHMPPASGPEAGAAGFIEVIVSAPSPVTFMSVITRNSTVTVAARAVGGATSASDSCVYIGNPSGSDVFHLQGSTTITATGCGIYINSSNSRAVQVTGNSSHITADYFNIYGGYSGHQTQPTAMTPHSAPLSNPMGNITGPTPPGGCPSTNASTTLSGSYTAPGGLVCFTKAVTLADGATLGAGLYVFENGVTIPTGATVTVNGGTLDLYGVGSSAGTLTQASNSVLNITAPTSGAYNAIAILQPLVNTTPLQVQFGSSNQTLDGVIYAPGAKVSLQDNGGGVTASGVYADTMSIKSSSLTIPSYSARHPTTTPVRHVTLAE